MCSFLKFFNGYEEYFRGYEVYVAGVITVVGVGAYKAFRGGGGKNYYFRYQDFKRRIPFYQGKPLPPKLDELFKRNALIYGLEDNAREPLRSKFITPDAFKKRVMPSGGIGTIGAVTADHLNNATWRDYREDGGILNNSIFNPATEERVTQEINRRGANTRGADRAAIKSILNEWRRALPDELRTPVHDEYFNRLLDHKRYSPVATRAEENLAVAQREGLNEAQAIKARFQSQTRRASKFGLEFQRERNRPVAFMLDYPGFGGKPESYEFQINKIRTGHRAGGGSGEMRVPITTSELRKAYRDSDRKGRQPDFFIGGKAVLAPWETNSDEWDQYGKYRKEKYRAAFREAGLKPPGNINGMSPNQAANALKDVWLNKFPDVPRLKGATPSLLEEGKKVEINKIKFGFKNI